jgi:hypothetical protein
MAENEVEKVRFSTRGFDEDSGVCFFEFGNGTRLEFDPKKCSDQIRFWLTSHGGVQKIGDSYASAKGNYGEAVANAQAVIDALYAGDWGPGREGGPRLAELAEAIARIKGTDLDKTRQAVEAATDEQRRNWRSNAKVRHAIAAIKAEKAQKALEASAAEEVVIDIK